MCRLAPTIFEGPVLDLFAAAYLIMRDIDDRVDNAGAGEAEIDAWLANVETALAEAFQASGSCLRVSALAVLADYRTSAPFTMRPFRALATSLRQDAMQMTLPDWPAFLDYCEGATVAPTAIYLALMLRASDAPLASHESEVWRLARPMARFCYIAHIARDLAKDAARDPRLLTLPLDHFADLAADRVALARRLQQEPTMRETVVSRLLRHLPELAEDTVQVRREVGPHLNPATRRALKNILAHYAAILQHEFRHDKQNEGRQQPRLAAFLSSVQAPI